VALRKSGFVRLETAINKRVEFVIKLNTYLHMGLSCESRSSAVHFCPSGDAFMTDADPIEVRAGGSMDPLLSSTSGTFK
jgi:hypothetical protein